MNKARTADGRKNLIGPHLRVARIEKGYTVRTLADALKERGYKMDRNIISRIENDERYVSDVELRALVEVLDVNYGYLIEGKKDV